MWPAACIENGVVRRGATSQGLSRICIENASGTRLERRHPWKPSHPIPSLSASAIRPSQAAENATTAATFALTAARLTRQAAPFCFYPAAVQEPLRPVLYVRTPPRAFKMCDAVDDKTCKHQCRKQSVPCGLSDSFVHSGLSQGTNHCLIS